MAVFDVQSCEACNEHHMSQAIISHVGTLQAEVLQVVELG
jgi:hypothetical protein